MKTEYLIGLFLMVEVLLMGCVTVNEKTCIESVEKEVCAKTNEVKLPCTARMTLSIPYSCNLSEADARHEMHKLSNMGSISSYEDFYLGNCNLQVFKWELSPYNELNENKERLKYSVVLHNSSWGRQVYDNETILCSSQEIDLYLTNSSGFDLYFDEYEAQFYTCNKTEKHTICIKEST